MFALPGLKALFSLSEVSSTIKEFYFSGNMSKLSEIVIRHFFKFCVAVFLSKTSEESFVAARLMLLDRKGSTIVVTTEVVEVFIAS